MESALKRPHVFVLAFLKFLHQTGARPFVFTYSTPPRACPWGFWTGSLRVGPTALGSLLVSPYPIPSKPLVCARRSAEIFSSFHSPFQFFDCDSRSLRHTESP